jgi:hypothetical protein
MGEACSAKENNANANKLLMGKLEENKPLDRPRHRRVHKFKVNLE